MPRPRLGDRIRRLRLARGWSLEELARRAGVTKPAVHMLERGTSKNPRLWTVVGIAAALGVTVDALVARLPRRRAR